MAVDATMRKLKIPQKFMPYLEKHRVYELLHDLGEKLAMEQPSDPLQFLKECLGRLLEGRDHRLIILMTPPSLDRTRLAQMISQKTGYGIVSRYLMKTPGNFYDPDTLAEFTTKYVSSSEREGWILSDFPDSMEEAKHLIKAGVVPTHAFLLLHKGQNEVEEHETMHTVDTSPSILLEHGNSLYHMRELFKSSLKVVKMKDRSMEDVADLCAKLTIKMPPHLAPKLFRVALLGPRGSRRRTLAKLLNKRFKMVHVDMNHLINTAKMMENEMGDEIRFWDRNDYTYSTKIIFPLLKDRLQQNDCLERGYVLTNFPTCVEDFIFLDSLDTPPNRVIFLDIDVNECLARLEDRVVNMYTGDLHSKKSIEANSSLKSQTLPHPDDDSCKVTEENKFYLARLKSMLEYCGGTCSVVDGKGPIKALFERVEAVLMSSSPAANPRSDKMPRLSLVKHEQLSVKSRMSYPTSRTEIVPLIDTDELNRRFKYLKGEMSSDIQEPDNSSTIRGDSVHLEDGTESPMEFVENDQSGVAVIQLFKGVKIKSSGDIL
uniref:Adenylate kinase 8 n=1 Tax=Graphocephala atropunctata TaxID=36148 RepID=A0A1B6L896_9HEMI